jgi:hypothetical protein
MKTVKTFALAQTRSSHGNLRHAQCSSSPSSNKARTSVECFAYLKRWTQAPLEAMDDGDLTVFLLKQDFYTALR